MKTQPQYFFCKLQSAKIPINGYVGKTSLPSCNSSRPPFHYRHLYGGTQRDMFTRQATFEGNIRESHLQTQLLF